MIKKSIIADVPVKSVHISGRKKRWQNYCADQEIVGGAGGVEFISDSEWRTKVPKGMVASELTAMSMMRRLPYQFRVKENMFNRELQYAFKTDGYIYFTET